ncbi:hypothetical protein D0544_09490 [Aestuariirhabdus litorea]|uniref:Uncharacterized protein n=1 Tax=Aestuariirhabdus litorea TaxID=2528527 RepID=A0A3P3VS50_9GAMM|nr:hypothetical protein D0544_09490 [Aestuariirhabdus litorea]
MGVFGVIGLVALLIESFPEKRLAPPQAPLEEAAVETADKPMDLEAHVHLKQLQLAFQQAVLMLHAKQYELAVVALHKVIEMDPEMPEAHTNMGFALLGLERWGAAKDFFIVATELDPSQLNAYYGMALAYAGLELYPQAIGAMVTYEHRADDADAYRLNAHQLIERWRTAEDSRGADERFIDEVIVPTLKRVEEDAKRLTEEREAATPSDRADTGPAGERG